MATIEELLARWMRGGVIDEPTAERIRAFERETKPERGGPEAPGLMEALVYLGVAIAAVGVFILVGANWEDLEDWARIAVIGVPGVLAVAAGQGLRSLPGAGMVRGGHMAWLAGAALLAGTAAVAGANADWDEENVVLATGAAATAVALVLWAFAPSYPQALGVGAALGALALGVGAQSEDDFLLVAGISYALVGLVAIGLSEGGLFSPLPMARLVSAFALAVGAFFAGLEEDQAWAESLAFVAGALLVAASIARGTLVYIVFGIAVVFAGLILTITRHVDDPTLAAAALIAIGAVMVAMVFLLARFKPWQREAVQ